MTNVVDGQGLKRLTDAGLAWLKTNQQIVNSYNVFPVPDGDTGTNMVLTMQSAFDEIKDTAEKNVGRVAQAIAHGALMGARGNSGVILSQIWRGFARALDDEEYLDATRLVHALAMARDTAYKGVVRPVEGTILTVSKDIALAAEAALRETSNEGTNDLVSILEDVVTAADRSVQHTPELLPVLKQAGVVDSGGKGLFFILEGMLRDIQGLPLDTATIVQPLTAMKMDEHLFDYVEEGQDYEVVLDFRPTSPLKFEDFYGELEEMGTSIQVGEGEGMFRLHIHVPAEKRYAPIDYAMKLGQVTKVTIENLEAQMQDLDIADDHTSLSKITTAFVEPGHSAVIAVAPGNGIARVFASLGVNAIVEGGQTMNPSIQEILHAIESLPTDKVIVLPNNKNIVMAAQSAADLTVKQVAVVPTKSVPQGLVAMLHWNPESNFDTLKDQMAGALNDVQTGEVTLATRSVELNGLQVEEGQIIGLLNGDLVISSQDVEDACLKLLKHAQGEKYELITLIYGAMINKQQANTIADSVRAAYPQQDIELQDGGQPHYHFIIGIE